MVKKENVLELLLGLGSSKKNTTCLMASFSGKTSVRRHQKS